MWYLKVVLGATEFKPNMFLQHLDCTTLSKTCVSLNPEFWKDHKDSKNGQPLYFIMPDCNTKNQPRYTKISTDSSKSHGFQNSVTFRPLQSWGAMWHGTGPSGWKEGVNRGLVFPALIILTAGFFLQISPTIEKGKFFIWTKPPLVWLSC